MTARIRACVWDGAARFFTWYDDGTAVLWWRDGSNETVFEGVYSLEQFNGLLIDYWMTPLGTGKKQKQATTARLPF